MKRVEVLDCTLRDGGYYNDWNFSPALVSNYLKAIGSSGVRVVEIGFRSLPKKGFLGAFAYSTDKFLESLPVPKGITLGVMVNAKEILEYEQGAKKAIDFLFQNAKDSPVSLVRVACHLSEYAASEGFISHLKSKGYRIGLNLMQASSKSPKELAEIASKIRSFGTVEVLYLADSLGSMMPSNIVETVSEIKKVWPGDFGMHTHNNMGQALANSLAAVAADATWLDGTVLGMGRGAGNVSTEYLLVELRERQLGDYYPDALFSLVMEEFQQLQRQYGWGPNLLYYLSGAYGIHPTYVQEMIGKDGLGTHHVLTAMEHLKKSGAASFNSESLEQAIRSNQGSSEGTWSAKDWAKGKPLLILAAGPGLKQHAEAVERYVQHHKPVVVCLNLHSLISPALVTAYAACHKMRLLMDSDQYRHLKKPLIAPLGTVPEVISGKLSDVRVLDYGMKVERDMFSVSERSCTIPSSLVAAYVMALGEASGAAHLLLAGFDGYGSADHRQSEMAHIFRCYRAREKALPLTAITPTTYDIPSGSVYSPEFQV